MASRDVETPGSHAHLVRADHFGGEGLPRAALGCRDHEQRLRAGVHDGKMRASCQDVFKLKICLDCN